MTKLVDETRQQWDRTLWSRLRLVIAGGCFEVAANQREIQQTAQPRCDGNDADRYPFPSVGYGVR